MPDEVEFATKPALAMKMLGHALDQENQADFVVSEGVYGNDSKIRPFLESQDHVNALAVASYQRLRFELQQKRVGEIEADVPKDMWFCFSVADGSNGPRIYDWSAAMFGVPADHSHQHWLLIQIIWPRILRDGQTILRSIWHRAHQADARAVPLRKTKTRCANVARGIGSYSNHARPARLPLQVCQFLPERLFGCEAHCEQIGIERWVAKGNNAAGAIIDRSPTDRPNG